MLAKNAISLENVSINYSADPIFSNISFEVPKGSMTVILGPNGAGKSSVLKAIMHEVRFEGLIKINGTNSNRKTLHTVSYAPQRKSVDMSFPINLFEFVSMGSYSRISCFSNLDKKEFAIIKKSMSYLGIWHKKDCLIRELSGGQFQKAVVARAMVHDCDVLILDEPFSEIDFASEKKIVSALQKMCSTGKTVIVVSHDLYKVDVFDWAILMNKRIVSYGRMSEVFTRENLRKTYNTDIKVFDNIIFNKNSV